MLNNLISNTRNKNPIPIPNIKEGIIASTFKNDELFFII